MTKALLCREHGLPDKLDLTNDWTLPELGPQDVQIRIHAAGLNFPDVLIIQGKYQIQPEMPFIPGGECAGVVEALGEEVTRWSVGDEIIHTAGAGCFCERTVVNQHSLMPKPKALSMVEAAGIGITYFTSYHALKQRAQLQPGETLLVLGAAGGVGSTAVELGKAMGAKVIAAASSDEKLALCKELGADEVINYSSEDLKARLKEITGGRGVDVVYDPVGGDFSEIAVRSMAWKGRFLVIGFANGPIPSIPLNLTLLKGCQIVGVFWGRFVAEEPDVHQDNVNTLWQWFEEGKIKPVVTDVFPLEEYQVGYAAMMERRAKGKVIFTLD